MKLSPMGKIAKVAYEAYAEAMANEQRAFDRLARLTVEIKIQRGRMEQASKEAAALEGHLKGLPEEWREEYLQWQQWRARDMETRDAPVARAANW